MLAGMGGVSYHRLVAAVSEAFGIADLVAEAEAIAAAYALPASFAELGAPPDLVERALPRVMEQALLRNNPRYSTALNTGGDLQAFASGLQRGGYATDPDYANKIAAVAGSLKLSSALPISANTGAL